jgi:hypothetical protein
MSFTSSGVSFLRLACFDDVEITFWMSSADLPGGVRTVATGAFCFEKLLAVGLILSLHEGSRETQ